MLVCEFCSKIISNKYNLKIHQKTKRCLDFQGKKVYGNKCKCGKLFTSSKGYNKHVYNCVSIYKTRIAEQEKKYEEKLRNQEEKYENKIRELQEQIKELATKAIEKPITINTQKNNYTNTMNIMNLAPLDMNELTKNIENIIMSGMDENHVIDGQAGVARLLSCCFTATDGRKLITCTDTSRGIWKSKDTEGNVIKDYKVSNIAKVVHPIAIRKADGIISEYDTKKQNTMRIKQLQSLINNYSKEYIKEEEYLNSITTTNSDYNNTIEKLSRIDKNIQEYDNEIQSIVISGLYDKNHIVSDDVLYRLYRGKREIYELKNDSTLFSKNLINLV